MSLTSTTKSLPNFPEPLSELPSITNQKDLSDLQKLLYSDSIDTTSLQLLLIIILAISTQI